MIDTASAKPLESNSNDGIGTESPAISSLGQSVHLDVASAYMASGTEEGIKTKIKLPSAKTLQVIAFFAIVIFIQISSRGTSNSMSMLGLIFFYMLATFIFNIFRAKRKRKTEQ